MTNHFLEDFSSNKELSEEEMMGMINEIDKFLKESDFKNLFNNTLEEALSNPISPNDIYDEIIENYSILLSILEIYDFKNFKFPDDENCRIINIDGTDFDFNDCFDHDDIVATEALCAIDCLIADLQADPALPVLNEVEKMMNNR